MHREADSQPQEKNGGKGSVALSKNSKQSCCVFQDIEPRKSHSILRKGTIFLGPQHSLQFSKGTLRHMKIRERKFPSQGVIQHADSHVRGRKTPKFKYRSQEGILKQARCARRDAWEMAKGIFKLKEQYKATFFSPSDVWCLTAPCFNETKWKKKCGRFRSLDAHAEQERSELSGNWTLFRVSRNPNNGSYSQRPHLLHRYRKTRLMTLRQV